MLQELRNHARQGQRFTPCLPMRPRRMALFPGRARRWCWSAWRPAAKQGIGYTYADAATGKLVRSLLEKVVRGNGCVRPRSHSPGDVSPGPQLGRDRHYVHGDFRHRQRAVGPARQVARVSRWSVCSVRFVQGIPVYGSGGFTSYDDGQLERQLGGWAEQGFSMVKMKVGTHPGGRSCAE